MAAAWLNPTIPEFKEYFVRDFPYNADPNLGVMDSDISKAFGQTNFNISQDLFPTQETYTIGYLYLAAHYLVIDLRMSSQGLNGQFNWVEQSKSVGSVSQSFAIPPRILENPYFSMLSRTNYGAKYLELLIPQLAGAVYPTAGRTLP